MAVIQFPLQDAVCQPVGQYIRLGESSYRKIFDLHAAGHLNANRFVVDASKIRFHREIIRMLRASGAEVVLDPRTAELSARSRFGGFAKEAPWAVEGALEPLGPEIFSESNPFDIFGKIARCAVEYDVDVVLAPTHFIGDPNHDGWFDIDRKSCHLLRKALDAAGGQSIAIDYLLVLRLTDLNDVELRSRVADGLVGLEFNNLWVRISTSNADTGPLTAQRFVRALASLHNLGVPIVLDYMGGLTAEALVSMNVASGIAHGLGERSSFTTSGWDTPPKKRDDSDGPKGRAKRISLTGCGKSFALHEIEVLLSAHGAKSLLLPNNPTALPNGPEDLRSDPRRFNAYEAERRIAEIERTPNALRPDVFAERRMKEAAATARKASKLNPKAEIANEKRVDVEMLRRRLAKHSQTLDKLRGTYEGLAEERSERGDMVRGIGPLRQSRPSAAGRL